MPASPHSHHGGPDSPQVGVVLTVAVSAILLTLTGPAAAFHPVGHEGPFLGVLFDDGQRLHHRYDNNPTGGSCIQVVANFTVEIRYDPPVDRLRLTVDHPFGSEVVNATGGNASLTFVNAWCTAFEIEVTGIAVAQVDVYEVTVERAGY